ncbi:DUF4184 family protein [Micromonospora sp. ATA32]|nr:DUF4184 family protein [Micromonospora sp. ATA32]
MPLTFPSHLAPVLPLKLWRPRWFDGVALTVGAVSPDVAYLAAGSRFDLGMRTHTGAGLFWWCLPVTLVYTWVVRRSIAGIAVHLPADRVFAWRDYAALGGVRHPWWITIGSALLGAASHVGWDRLTHTDGWLRALGVDWYAATGDPWWTVADPVSTTVGAAVVLGLALRLGQRREIFDGEPPPAPQARPRVFWTAAALVVAVGAPVLPALPAATALTPTGVRLLHLGALALIVGGLAVTATPTDQRPLARTGPGPARRRRGDRSEEKQRPER